MGGFECNRLITEVTDREGCESAIIVAGHHVWKHRKRHGQKPPPVGTYRGVDLGNSLLFPGILSLASGNYSMVKALLGGRWASCARRHRGQLLVRNCVRDCGLGLLTKTGDSKEPIGHPRSMSAIA